MKRILGALFALSLFATSALAQTPLGPNGGGTSVIPLGPLGGPLLVVPLGPGLQSSGSGPPPTCSTPAAQFCLAANSMYVNAIGF